MQYDVRRTTKDDVTLMAQLTKGPAAGQRRRRLTYLLLIGASLGAIQAQAGLLSIRSYDGTGNHGTAPSTADYTWGSTGIQLRRIAPANYPGDGSGDTVAGAPGLPNARDISNRLSAQDPAVNANDLGMSGFAWQWGQFIDHDIDLTHNDASNGTAPIAINDPADPFSPGPMPFNRSTYDPATGTGPGNPRQQVNDITAWLDASNIYGPSQAAADNLRTFSGGLLKSSAGNLLPTVTVPNPDPSGPDLVMFQSGDERANEQVGLTAMHTMFMREHNRLAGALAAADPALDDETIYQTARKIVGAELQKITYEEFLPTLLGGMAPAIGPGDYDPTVDPGIVNAFSTALYRFGHTMLPSAFELRGADGTLESTLALRDAFFTPDFLLSDPSNLERVLRGLAAQPAQQIDNMLVDDVRNFMFGVPGAGGLDLAALNIQRGRDHGLAGYNELRMAYGLAPVSDYDQVALDQLVRDGLLELYGAAAGVDNVDLIDAWVGALAEQHLAGAAVGELIAAAMADQFTRLAVSDSFFYLWDADLLGNADIAAVIDLGQVSLANVLSWNTDVGPTLQADAFHIGTVAAPPTLLLFTGLGLLVGWRRRTGAPD